MSPVVLDAGGLSRLARRTIAARELLRALRTAGLWPALVPSVVLTEALTGDARKDFAEERLLAMCDIEAGDEHTARRAGGLRSAARRGSAVDAIVVAVAEEAHAPVLTQDVGDLKALAAHTDPAVRVEKA